MAITSLDNWIAAPKQQVTMFKQAARTTLANMPYSVFELAGQPGAGVLAGTSTTAGVVPTDATAGFPLLNAFSGSNKGYLSDVYYSNTVAGDIYLFDMLWKGGAYACPSTTNLSAQPSYSSRVPGGTDFTNTEIWVECVTAITGNLSIAVTYTNQAGTTGRTTGTVATGVAPALGRMFRLPLQAGDTGVQKIESIVSSVSTAGTFNILVLRKLDKGRVGATGGLDFRDFTQLGMVEVFADSALFFIVQADSTSSGVPEVFLTIANG